MRERAAATVSGAPVPGAAEVGGRAFGAWPALAASMALMFAAATDPVAVIRVRAAGAAG
ncbi:MAG: hypothetical protein LBQ79_12815 [Deltaproteobacteria bacterium]|nr:hypothetical protein [Deltaproteobacteria bacterium]